MIKLVATDLDGTLFYPKDRIFGMPQSNANFIKNYLKKGLRFLFISGRSTMVVPKLKRRFKTDIPFLGCNGSYLLENGQLSQCYPLDRKALFDFYCWAKSYYSVLIFFLFDEHIPLYLHMDKLSKPLQRSFVLGNDLFYGYYREKLVIGEDSFVKKLTETDNYKMMLSFGFGQSQAIKAHQVAFDCQERFGKYFSFAVSDSSIEITAKNINKGFGLKNYCLKHNLSFNDVFVIGDSGNDLFMFQDFPHTFSMNHAPDFVKSQANHHVDKVSDLEKYLIDTSLTSNDQVKIINFDKEMEK